MSRRDGRGVGEVVIITISKSMSGCGSVNVCTLHCGGTIPVHFSCKSAFLTKHMVVKLTRGDRIKRCHANGCWVARDIQKSRHHSESNSGNVSTYHVGYCAMWGDVKLLVWERERQGSLLTSILMCKPFKCLFIYLSIVWGQKKMCDAILITCLAYDLLLN